VIHSVRSATHHLQRALHHYSTGAMDLARAACAAAQCVEPRDPGVLHLLGVIEYAAGHQGLARALLREAADSPSASPIHLLSYAELCCKPDDLEGAIAAVRRALALDRALPLTWLCLGRLLFAKQQYAESRDCFECSLRLAPDSAPATCGLANALGRLGETAAALDLFAGLIARRPDYPEARDAFALLLQDLGRYPEALTQAGEAVARQPQTLEFHLRAADIELHMGRYWPALERLGAIEARGLGDANFLALKAHLLRLVDQFQAAAQVCEDAFSQGIESAELLRAHGLALDVAGRHTEALASFDRAAARGSATALSDKGVMLMHLGRFALASAAFGQALDRQPTLAEAWYNQSNVDHCLPGDPRLAAMERLLAGPRVSRDRMLLHFALGKSYLDVGEPRTAIRHWHAANRLKRASVDYDADLAAKALETIAARAWPAPPSITADPDRLSELPVFIVGMPRSGSSLVEQILASHPAVHGAGEQLQLRGLFEAAATEADPAPERQTKIATQVTARLRHAAPHALRVIDKDLANFRHLGIIHRLMPRARIIHCRRDPLDTCFSAYTKLFLGELNFTYELAELGRFYRAYHALMAHWRASLPGAVFIDVDYEELVAAPEPIMRRLIDFLGLSWDDACTRFFAKERAVRTASATAVRQPIYSSSIGRARSLAPDLAPLIAALGPLATASRPTGSPPP